MGNKFPYQFKNSEEVPGHKKAKEVVYTRHQTQVFKFNGLNKYGNTTPIKLQKNMTFDRDFK